MSELPSEVVAPWWWGVVAGGMNQPNEKLTTAQAAKLLGVRTDTIHVMKAEGHLTVVGRGHHGTNLFALADVQQLKVKRLKAQRDVPRAASQVAERGRSCVRFLPGPTRKVAG